MVYQAKPDIVLRVIPLLDLLATRTIDKALLLQYLLARSAVDWGVLELLVDDEDRDAFDEPARTITFRDRTSGAEHRIRYPSCLPPEVEPMILEEYRRLAGGRPLSMMALPLFEYFFSSTHCAHCRWRGDQFSQFHRECQFAGRPVNFERDDPRRSD